MDLRTFKENVKKEYKDDMFWYLREEGLKIKDKSDKRRAQLKTEEQVKNYQKEIKKSIYLWT